MTHRTHAQRAATWLSLAVAVLIALLPSGGAMLCLGHEGHVGLGADPADSACPCDHGTAVPSIQIDSHGVATSERMATASSSADQPGHPPCDDFALDPPEVFRDAGVVQRLPKSLGDPSGDDVPGTGLHALESIRRWADSRSQVRARGLIATTAPLRPQLEHRRVVVLLV